MIDATFAFRDQPAGEQTVSVYFLNKGSTACRLIGTPSTSFAVDGHSMVVEQCPFCGPDGKPMPWERRPENQVVLGPGATTSIDMSWDSTGVSCQWAEWANFLFGWTEPYDPDNHADFLFVPSGWPMRICSSVRSFGYRTVEEFPSIEGEQGPALRVSLLQESVYSDEHPTLRIALAESAQSDEKPIGCASLYTVRYTAPRGVRLDPLRAVGFSQVDAYTPEQIREDRERAWPEWKKDFKRECDVRGGATTAEAEIAASELAKVSRIEWRTAPLPGGEPEFLSVATHFDVLDVDSLAPNWGEAVKGIRAGISVDRERFSVGERVPLHLRWEIVDASDPLGKGECGDPKPDVEILDSHHHVLKRIPTYSMCMGHGWGPFEIAKGERQDEFREFTTVSDPALPDSPILPGPGTYYLVSVWSPRVLEKFDADTSALRFRNEGRMGDIYATARSLPVRIEVAPRGHP